MGQSRCPMIQGGLRCAFALASMSWVGLAVAANAAVPAAPLARRPLDSYSLTVRLELDKHLIKGSGELLWTNRSGVTVDHLYWHMYLNAFRNRDTYFFRSSSRRARSGRALISAGSVEFTHLRITAPYAQDLLPGLAAHSPEDPLDQTDLRVALPRPVASGESVTLSMGFRSVLPSFVERTGVSRDFVLAGQWFPKLAVIENDGSWSHFRFHPFAEFYSPFANYDVTLDVPTDMVVGATGELRETTQGKNGRQRLSYRAPAVHDFAWTGWRHFQNLTEKVDNTEISILYPPGHLRNAQVTLRTVQQALPHFEERYGSYPHASLTIVHPPRHAAPAGGMEYPSFITTGGAWYSTYFSHAVSAVTIHELAHQWFQGSLASDEHRWPFLDEGLASYADGLEGHTQFGTGSAATLAGWKLSVLAFQRAHMLGKPHETPLGNAAADFENFGQLAAVIYSRSVLLLQTLGNVYGQQLLDKALNQYANRYAGRHPTLADFVAEMAPLGTQALANLQAVLQRGSTVDFKVVRIDNTVGPGNSIHTTIELERRGDLVFPVEVLLETADGRSFRKSWDAVASTQNLEVDGSSPVIRAWIDPDTLVVLDEDLLNNALSTRQRWAANFFERILYLLELSLAWFAF